MLRVPVGFKAFPTSVFHDANGFVVQNGGVSYSWTSSNSAVFLLDPSNGPLVQGTGVTPGTSTLSLVCGNGVPVASLDVEVLATPYTPGAPVSGEILCNTPPAPGK